MKVLSYNVRRCLGTDGRLSPATFPSRWPLLRLDHLFSRGGVRVASLEAVRAPLARRASDHLPLLVELEIEPAPAGAAA